ncbi:MAG: ABC transporter ATP-binding protein/permease [Deltaproteobacteria bacterium]|jgi:ATP-binding cassette subfamily B protein|nr:ABC transporter ATP-binding protein/permease [Deltaproteobacteria bacterium]
MLKAMRIIAGDLAQLRSLTLLHILHTILTGLPIVFLFFVVSELLKPRAEADVRALVFCCVMVAVIMGSNVLLAAKVYVKDYLKAISITTGARLRLADHLRLLSLGFFKKRDPGEISALMLQDMAKVEQLFSHLFIESISFTVLPALMALFFFSQDARLTLLLLAAVALAVPALWAGQRLIARYGERQIRSRNRAASRILEYVQGLAVLKAFSLTGKGFKRLDQSLLDLRRDSIHLEAAAGAPIVVFSVILELGMAALIILATYLLHRGQLDLVVYILFMIVGLKFFEPLLNLALFFSEFRYMSLAGQRISGILSEPPLPVGGVLETPEGRGVVFEDVTFGYSSDRPIINNLSLTFPGRAMTALVGPSGGGKTTVTSLMARFWDPWGGRILIGGADIRNMAPEDLNAMFSFVFQEVYLFAETVYENIRIGRKSASEEEVMEAARLAQCRDFILKLEDGYQTKVGEGGASLSGGERQRVSIARAILKNAPIVVLDEATASMDPENELNIQRAIGALVRDKTLVVIAHRLRTVVDADQIVVIDRGRAAEKGTHEELMSGGGLYRALWDEQQKTGGWKFAKK